MSCLRMPDWSRRKLRSCLHVSPINDYNSHGKCTYHALHESNKAPECDGIILHDCIDGRKQIAHALNVAEILVVFVVRKKHVFHLLQVNIGTSFRKRRVRVRVGNVLAGEDGDIAICAMYVFLYTTDPIEWDKSASFQARA